MVCRKRGQHPKAECEDTDKVAASQLRKMKSDLFDKHGSIPAAQHEIMHRNASASPFLQLPIEIRLRIYKLVLGGHQLWIGYVPPMTWDPHSKWIRGKLSTKDDRKVHDGGGFFNCKSLDARGLDIGLVRVGRQIFTETSLLPYELNSFTFESNSVLRTFEKLVRPGKKQVQKKAMGQCMICSWETFCFTLRNSARAKIVDDMADSSGYESSDSSDHESSDSSDCELSDEWSAGCL